jgi:serine/threonine-protein kinase
MGRLDEAIATFRQAVRDDPANVGAHVTLGNALKDAGRLDEAVASYRRAIALDPKNQAPRTGLRSVLMRQGRGDEVRAAWQKDLEADPPDHDAWYGYAELCLFLGQEAEYRRARQALLRRFGASTDPFVAERTARACLLLPASEDELRQAVALVERALAGAPSKPDWAYPFFLFARGLAEYRQGRPDSALATMTDERCQGLGPNPRLVLAMAQHRRGQREAARQTLAAAVVPFDWSADQADNPGMWLCHVLRREAETLILPDLPAFLRGEHEPRDNDERLALLGTCQFQGLHRTAARLYADAFAADPALAEDWKTENRYRAAGRAALAGCGRGADGARLGEAERARWRRQARAWLQADLLLHAQRLDDAEPAVEEVLRRWLAAPSFAGVRGAEALAGLPAEERQEWAKFWADVEAVRRKAREKAK